MPKSSNQCKYTNDRLAQMVKERGVTAAIEYIDHVAIADPTLRRKWETARRIFNEIEETLGV